MCICSSKQAHRLRSHCCPRPRCRAVTQLHRILPAAFQLAGAGVAGQLFLRARAVRLCSFFSGEPSVFATPTIRAVQRTPRRRRPRRWMNCSNPKEICKPIPVGSPAHSQLLSLEWEIWHLVSGAAVVAVVFFISTTTCHLRLHHCRKRFVRRRAKIVT